jgi:uncharacterized protein YecE (DUF72 family)
MSVEIGTSGWTYPHWQQNFFPESLPHDDRLTFYARTFSTVEINTTFYGLPTLKTVRHWRDVVPASFRFAIKGSRYTTHNKRLLEPRKSTSKFFRAIKPLQGRITAVLFQLPPNAVADVERLEAFLKAMPRDYRYAFEFRHVTWFQEDVYAILRKYNCALCFYDLRGTHAPEEVTADFVYVRLHGPEAQAYRGSYPPKALRAWKEKVTRWKRQKKDVFIYFDNDEKGYAPVNALELMKLTKSEKPKLKRSLSLR